MNTSNLNLTRKWRSKNFDQIVGQDLCVRILKNGLYLNSFFPVYLFSGQRGCGKTSTARVFAAAINCAQLENFQKDAKSFIVPCLECISCKSMQQGKHPDFIEIDAASHTGVDNIRNIIEASTLLPLIGRKKIYLIDEAHMLSKAAFNAFLKILEEPPASVLFILATTDVQKIIDTVRSRSFQLFFTSVSQDVLLKYLEDICMRESITYDIDALNIIIRESEGSVRDAINLLEQVRFANSIVNKASVCKVLGHISDDHLLMLLDHLINRKNIQEFLKFLDEINYHLYSAEFIWNKLLELFRCAIRIKYGVSNKYFQYQDELSKIVSKCSLNSITNALNEFCKNELIFFKSSNKSLFLELICLRIINSNFFINNSNSNNPITNNIVPKNIVNIDEEEDEEDQNFIEEDFELSAWSSFVLDVKNIKDPLIESVFCQAKFESFDKSTGEVTISFPKKFIFFKELIDDSFNTWSISLKKIFESKAFLKVNFQENMPPVQVVKEDLKANIEVKKEPKIEKKINSAFDFSDEQKWKMTNFLLKNFPGTVTQIQEAINE